MKNKLKNKLGGFLFATFVVGMVGVGILYVALSVAKDNVLNRHHAR